MVVLGLPRAAECVLTSLLAENSVSSWKLTGDGRSTVFILRLSGGNNTTGAPLQRTGWRRKAPCELRRDQNRAQLRQQSGQGQSASSCVPTDNSSASRNNINKNLDQVNDHQETTVDMATEASELLIGPSFDKDSETQIKCVAQCVNTRDVTQYSADCGTPQGHATITRQDAREAGEDRNVGQVCLQTASVPTAAVSVNTATCALEGTCQSDLTIQHCDSVVMSDHSGSDVSEVEEEERSIEQLAVDGGIKLSEVELCVRELTNRRTKSMLRDENRNRTLSKVVLDHRGGREVLIAESDDFLMSLDLRGDGRTVWYLKEQRRPLEPSAKQLQTCLQTWPPVDTEEYVSGIEEVMISLDILVNIFRSLLN